MNYRSKKNLFYRRPDESAFTFIEVIMAVTIIAVTVTTVLTVMTRCLEAAIDNRTRMQAFELARENMEKLLALNSVSDQAEFGTSEKNPDIQWTSIVEPFTEPTDSEMWVQAVCSATYIDSKGAEQSIELTHWLSEVPKNIQKMILAQRQKELELMDKYGKPGSYSDEQIEEFALEMDISVRDAKLLLENMSMHQAAKVITLSQSTGISLNQSRTALNMPADEAVKFIADQTGDSPEKTRDDLNNAESIPPEDFPDPEPEPVIEPEPTGPEPEILCGYTASELDAIPFDRVFQMVLNGCD